jgi:hypothetical protein
MDRTAGFLFVRRTAPVYWPECDEVALLADAGVPEVLRHALRRGVCYLGLGDGAVPRVRPRPVPPWLQRVQQRYELRRQVETEAAEAAGRGGFTPDEDRAIEAEVARRFSRLQRLGKV